MTKRKEPPLSKKEKQAVGEVLGLSISILARLTKDTNSTIPLMKAALRIAVFMVEEFSRGLSPADVYPTTKQMALDAWRELKEENKCE